MPPSSHLEMPQRKIALPALCLVLTTTCVNLCGASDSDNSINATTQIVQTRPSYSFLQILENSILYIGAVIVLLAVYCLITWVPKISRYLVPRWFNNELPPQLVTGFSAPSREQVADTIVHSDLVAGVVHEVKTSLMEKNMSIPPSCGEVRSCAPCCRKCVPPKVGFVQWLWTPWVTSELQYIERAGMDGYLLFRTMRLLLIFASLTVVVVLSVLVPTYYLLSIPCNLTSPSTGFFTDLSACNVTEEAGVICSCGIVSQVALSGGEDVHDQQAAAVVVQAVLSAAFLFLLSREFEYWMKVRRAYCETAPPEIYSVMVRFIPAYLRSEGRLRQFFEDLYPGMVHSVNFCPVDKTGLGAAGHVPALEHVRYQIAREEAINGIYRNLETNKNIRCKRCRDPSHSMQQLRTKEEEVLRAIEKAHTSFYEAAAEIAGMEPAAEHAYHLPSVADVFSTDDVPWSHHRYAAEQERKAQFRMQSKSRKSKASKSESRSKTPSARHRTTGAFSINADIENASAHEDFNDAHSNAAHSTEAVDIFSCNAFVTFKSAVVAFSCARDTVVAAASQMKLVPARQPRDVRWEKLNKHVPGGSGPVNSTIGVLYFLILITWGGVVFIVGNLTSQQTLECLINVNCTDQSQDNVTEGLSTEIVTIISTISPLFLQALSAIVKPLIAILVRMKFVPFHSEVDREVFVLFWVFQMLQNFLLYSIGAQLVPKLLQYVKYPLELLTSIGTSIPEGASFYIIYIETEILFTLTLAMVRAVWFANFLLRLSLCGCKWPLSKMGKFTILCGSCGTPGMPSLSSTGAPLIRVLFIFLIVNVYAVLQPLVAIAGMLYAILSLTVYTHNALATSVPIHDTGGLYWRNIYKIIVASIIIAQGVLLSIVLLSSKIELSIAQGVVIIATAVTSFAIYQPHRHDVKAYPLHLASKIDASRVSASNRNRQERVDLARSRSATASETALSSPVQSSQSTPAMPSRRKKATVIAHLSPTSSLGGNSSLSEPLLTGETEHAYGEGVTHERDRSSRPPSVVMQPPQNSDSASDQGRKGATIVVIPPHIWRNPVQPISAFVSRSYLVPATGLDIVLSNKELVHTLQSEQLPVDQAREQVLTATFVYDYMHPTLRTARNVQYSLASSPAPRSF